MTIGLLSIFMLNGCHSVSETAMKEFLQNANSECPFQTDIPYNVIKSGVNIGQISFGQRDAKFKSGKMCYLRAANEIGSLLNKDLPDFFKRQMQKISDDKYVIYRAPIAVTNNIYYMEKSYNEFKIWGECKMPDGKSCPELNSKAEIIARADTLNYEPQYIFEVAQ